MMGAEFKMKVSKKDVRVKETYSQKKRGSQVLARA
jgi:hypothetical protein